VDRIGGVKDGEDRDKAEDRITEGLTASILGGRWKVKDEDEAENRITR
jgi:hypothetical protein